MTFINYAAREINCKIVYYGPGLCGKTTNLQYIYDSTAAQAKGKLISLATETDRTLFFDFLPLDLGTVRGFKHRGWAGCLGDRPEAYFEGRRWNGLCCGLATRAHGCKYRIVIQSGTQSQ